MRKPIIYLKPFVFALVFLSIISCTPTVQSPNEPPQQTEETKPAEPETPSDPCKESPLSSVSITQEKITAKDFQGTWLMYPGGTIEDKLILYFDSTGKQHKVVYSDKEGDFITNQISITSTQIVQIYLSGMANYIVLSFTWYADDELDLKYYDKNTGRTYRHSLVKYSDSFIDETAFEDTSLLYGLWVNADKTKGLRFLSDGTLWIYKGNSSEKCKWKDSDGNALAVMDSFGFSEKVPFTKIGDNLLVYKGEKYFKAE